MATLRSPSCCWIHRSQQILWWVQCYINQWKNYKDLNTRQYIFCRLTDILFSKVSVTSAPTESVAIWLVWLLQSWSALKVYMKDEGQFNLQEFVESVLEVINLWRGITPRKASVNIFTAEIKQALNRLSSCQELSLSEDATTRSS